MQLRVVRAFKSTLEDLEERRSIHSLRSLRNLQQAQNPTSSLFAKNAFLKSLSRDQSPPGNITIQVPTSRPHEPLNINDINARYIDDDDVDESNDKTKETKI